MLPPPDAREDKSPKKPLSSEILPAEIAGWKAEGPAKVFDRESVYDYLDGGAEIYLEYGMKSLRAQRYSRPGEPSVVADLFEMDSPAGAFGAFTFEREDEGAGIGQGSEYGGGLLRFWQGNHFAFVQAEKETPASRETVLALGRAIAQKLGEPGAAPRLPEVLPGEGFRPLSVRFARSPLLLQIVEPSASGNPLDLPRRCEAVVARYGPKGNPERVLVARCPDSERAKRGVANFLKVRFSDAARPGEPFQTDAAWSIASPCGAFAVLVLDAPEGKAARKRLDDTRRKLEEVAP